VNAGLIEGRGGILGKAIQSPMKRTPFAMKQHSLRGTGARVCSP
jgi:hypothetical protein